MNEKSGSTIVLVTILSFIVLVLGAFIGWQWHNRQMEDLRLSNLSLQAKVEEFESNQSACPINDRSELEATASTQPESKESTRSATNSSDLK